MDRDKEVRDGQWAAQLLGDTRWIGIWEAYRLALFSKIENAKTDEGTLRGKQMLGVANDVRAALEGMVNRGKAAAHEIKLEEERKKSKYWPWAA